MTHNLTIKGCLLALALAWIGFVTPGFCQTETPGDHYAYEGDVLPPDHVPAINYNTAGTADKTSTDGSLLTLTDLPQYDGIRFTAAFTPTGFSAATMTMELRVRVTSGAMTFVVGDSSKSFQFGITPTGVTFPSRIDPTGAIVADFTQFRRLRIVIENGQLSAYVQDESNYIQGADITGGAFPAVDFYADHAGQATNCQLDYIRSTTQVLHPEQWWLPVELNSFVVE
ncbi:MAG TPA: hypothetical protein PLS90_10195 [Candidatus Sumerlaeota bacterium]|nr:hypothetical protein [Candidatus Sumerlaeota bacterium]HOR29537.1 hypothetical protein [Candidatus Sumerlaeota bacterium]HPK02812.1 hypothetical protein [Candidatus Sumerlaeota bacterium]